MPLETLDVSGIFLKGPVPPEVCRKNGINGNRKEGYLNCDVIACSVGSFSRSGKAGNNHCVPCISAFFLGSKGCTLFHANRIAAITVTTAHKFVTIACSVGSFNRSGKASKDHCVPCSSALFLGRKGSTLFHDNRIAEITVPTAHNFVTRSERCRGFDRQGKLHFTQGVLFWVRCGWIWCRSFKWLFVTT